MDYELEQFERYFPHLHLHHNSALTRVVWELNPVRRGEGGTLFLTGSPKEPIPRPHPLQIQNAISERITNALPARP